MRAARYGDGASFSGFRPDPWPVPGTNTTEKPEGEVLYFRGIKNIDGVIDWAMDHGLKTATEFVLTGGSAGGLSTFLHADRVAARVEAEAPKCAKIRAAPVVGYFLDHDNFAHDSASAVANTPSWNHANYVSAKHSPSVFSFNFFRAIRTQYHSDCWDRHGSACDDGHVRPPGCATSTRCRI